MQNECLLKENGLSFASCGLTEEAQLCRALGVKSHASRHDASILLFFFYVFVVNISM